MDVPVPFGRILLAPPSPQGAAARPENPSPPGNAPEAARPPLPDRPGAPAGSRSAAPPPVTP